MDHLENDDERIGCKLLITSVSGVAVKTDNPPEVEPDMVVEVDSFGRFNTYVHRVSAGEVEFAFTTDTHKRWLHLTDLSQSLN